MTAARVVETLDEVEDGHPGFGLRAELRAVEQLALQSGKETLGGGVVEAINDRAHRRTHAGFPAAFAEGNFDEQLDLLPDSSEELALKNFVAGGEKPQPKKTKAIRYASVNRQKNSVRAFRVGDGFLTYTCPAPRIATSV